MGRYEYIIVIDEELSKKRSASILAHFESEQIVPALILPLLSLKDWTILKRIS